MKAKAVCVMRTDLRNTDGHKVPKGKLIAQGGHAFVALITNLLIRQPYPCEHSTDRLYFFFYPKENPVRQWIDGDFTKIVLAVDSEKELEEIYFKAMAAGLPVVDIVDNGTTEFGKATFTCIGIGPDWEEKIDKITGHLKGFS
jgi:peptidyl-tRNA hydrolase, PTH2 family